jgi:hypothetical protein
MTVARFGSKTGAIRIPGERNLGWPNPSIPIRWPIWKKL